MYVLCCQHEVFQLGWDGVSEESWDRLRSELFAKTRTLSDDMHSSSLEPPSDDAVTRSETAPKKILSSTVTCNKTAPALAALPPKIKPSALSSEYKTLKNSLQRIDQRASGLLQVLDSKSVESDHMLTFDPRWLSQYADDQDEQAGPGPFELAIQKSNKLLDFLDRKQREQEACEAMMQQLMDAFNSADQERDVRDFGQVVRAQTIADATGDWDGLQAELHLQVRSLEFLLILRVFKFSSACHERQLQAAND
jgi:hypothetical protein